MKEELWELKRLIRKEDLKFNELLLIKEELISRSYTVMEINNNYISILYCELLDTINHEIEEHYYKYPLFIGIPMNIIGKILFHIKNYDILKISKVL